MKAPCKLLTLWSSCRSWCKPNDTQIAVSSLCRYLGLSILHLSFACLMSGLHLSFIMEVDQNSSCQTHIIKLMPSKIYIYILRTMSNVKTNLLNKSVTLNIYCPLVYYTHTSFAFVFPSLSSFLLSSFPWLTFRFLYFLIINHVALHSTSVMICLLYIPAFQGSSS